jgi:excisionase family DNA binding protein
VPKTAHNSEMQSIEEDNGRGQIMTAAVEPVYITRRQAAERLSCSDQTISKLIKTRSLPAFYLGRAVRIKLSDLEAMLSNSSANSGRVQ